MRAATLDQRIAAVGYGWEGTRNNSPSVQRVNGSVIRRNRAKAPIATPWTALWGDGAGQLSKSILPSGRVAAHALFTAIAATGQVRIDASVGGVYGVPVTPGETVTMSMDVASSVGSIRLSVDFYSAANVWLINSNTSVGVNSCSIDPDEPSRASLTLLVPENAAFLRAYLYQFGGSTGGGQNVGAWYQGGDLFVETGSHGGIHFDGDTAVNAATINGVTL